MSPVGLFNAIFCLTNFWFDPLSVHKSRINRKRTVSALRAFQLNGLLSLLFTETVLPTHNYGENGG